MTTTRTAGNLTTRAQPQALQIGPSTMSANGTRRMERRQEMRPNKSKIEDKQQELEAKKSKRERPGRKEVPLVPGSLRARCGQVAESGRSLSTIVPFETVFSKVRQFLRTQTGGKRVPCLGTKSGCVFSSSPVSRCTVGQKRQSLRAWGRGRSTLRHPVVRIETPQAQAPD